MIASSAMFATEWARCLGWHLTRLTDFSGREGRRDFVIYAISVLVAVALLWALAMSPMVDKLTATAVELETEQVTQGAVQYTLDLGNVTINGWHPRLVPLERACFALASLILLIQHSLLASAVVRRLHDVGLSGRPLVLPAGVHVVAILSMPIWGVPWAPPSTAFMAVFFAGALLLMISGFAMLLAGEGKLLRPGSVGPNRYDLIGGDHVDP